MLWIYFITLLVAWPSLAQRSCSSSSRDRMRQCHDTLMRNIQRRVNDMTRSDMRAHCMSVRDDFNCLLRETRCLPSESERNINGDSIRNALKYIRDACDSVDGRWRDRSCFIGDGMKACENNHPLAGSQFSSYNPETCRKYNLFEECVTDYIRRTCRSEDEKFLGQYLVDSAQDLAWNCGDSASLMDDRDRDRNRNRDDNGRNYDDRYNDRYASDRDRDRDQWRSGYDRDGYRGRDRDSDRYGSDRYYGSGSSGYNRNGTDITCCRNERCDRNRMSQCRDSLSRTIDSRSSGYQDSQKCRRARDDFNCLLWQTSKCASRDERDRMNDIFRRARDFISRNCDSYGRWNENSCYKSSGMQRCENSLTNTRGGANYESCRAYRTFRDCMIDELERRCAREDDLYQGAYLVDKAQEMSWQCGEDQYNGRNQYSTFDRRDQYDNPSYGSSYDENQPQHLDDDDAMCLSRAKYLTDECKNKLNEKKRELYAENDYEVRQRMTCCSAREFRNCLYDATRKVCQSERRRVVESLMGRQLHELNSYKCQGIYDSDCSTSSINYASFILLSACMGILSTLFSLHL